MTPLWSLSVATVVLGESVHQNQCKFQSPKDSVLLQSAAVRSSVTVNLTTNDNSEFGSEFLKTANENESETNNSILQTVATSSGSRRRGSGSRRRGSGLCSSSDKRNYHAWCTQWISPKHVQKDGKQDSHWCHTKGKPNDPYNCGSEDQWRFCNTKYEGNMAKLFGKQSDAKNNAWAKCLDKKQAEAVHQCCCTGGHGLVKGDSCTIGAGLGVGSGTKEIPALKKLPTGCDGDFGAKTAVPCPKSRPTCVGLKGKNLGTCAKKIPAQKKEPMTGCDGDFGAKTAVPCPKNRPICAGLKGKNLGTCETKVPSSDAAGKHSCYELRVKHSRGFASNCKNLGCHTTAKGGDEKRLVECQDRCDATASCNVINFVPTGASGSSGVGRCCRRHCTKTEKEADLKLNRHWKGWDVYVAV